jgi:hypothetical protein
MCRFITPRERSQIAMVTGSKPINGDNLRNVRLKDSRHSRNKMREYLKKKRR